MYELQLNNPLLIGVYTHVYNHTMIYCTAQSVGRVKHCVAKLFITHLEWKTLVKLACRRSITFYALMSYGKKNFGEFTYLPLPCFCFPSLISALCSVQINYGNLICGCYLYHALFSNQSKIYIITNAKFCKFIPKLIVTSTLVTACYLLTVT